MRPRHHSPSTPAHLSARHSRPTHLSPRQTRCLPTDDESDGEQQHEGAPGTSGAGTSGERGGGASAAEQEAGSHREQTAASSTAAASGAAPAASPAASSAIVGAGADPCSSTTSTVSTVDPRKEARDARLKLVPGKQRGEAPGYTEAQFDAIVSEMTDGQHGGYVAAFKLPMDKAQPQREKLFKAYEGVCERLGRSSDYTGETILQEYSIVVGSLPNPFTKLHKLLCGFALQVLGTNLDVILVEKPSGNLSSNYVLGVCVQSHPALREQATHPSTPHAPTLTPLTCTRTWRVPHRAANPFAIPTSLAARTTAGGQAIESWVRGLPYEQVRTHEELVRGGSADISRVHAHVSELRSLGVEWLPSLGLKVPFADSEAQLKRTLDLMNASAAAGAANADAATMECATALLTSLSNGGSGMVELHGRIDGLAKSLLTGSKPEPEPLLQAPVGPSASSPRAGDADEQTDQGE